MSSVARNPATKPSSSFVEGDRGLPVRTWVEAIFISLVARPLAATSVPQNA
jgi:hypothetical protein